MNQLVHPHLQPTTQAAEGLPRRRWTVAEIEQLSALGVFGGIERPRERFELIGGEIVPMNAKGSRHEIVKKELQRFWFPLVSSTDVDLITETTLRYAADSFLEPDFYFWPRAVPLPEIACTTCLLLVEVADSSLAYDTGRKARIYASLGLREYWVIDANSLTTRVHLQPGAEGFADMRSAPAAERLVPSLIPALAICLADLGIDPFTP